MFVPSMTLNMIYNLCPSLSQSIKCNRKKKSSFPGRDSVKFLYFQERILELWIGLYYYFIFYLNHLIVSLCFLKSYATCNGTKYE